MAAGAKTEQSINHRWSMAPRVRKGIVPLFWLIAASLAAVQKAMQYTGFGGLPNQRNEALQYTGFGSLPNQRNARLQRISQAAAATKSYKSNAERLKLLNIEWDKFYNDEHKGSTGQWSRRVQAAFQQNAVLSGIWAFGMSLFYVNPSLAAAGVGAAAALSTLSNIAGSDTSINEKGVPWQTLLNEDDARCRARMSDIRVTLESGEKMLMAGALPMPKPSQGFEEEATGLPMALFNRLTMSNLKEVRQEKKLVLERARSEMRQETTGPWEFESDRNPYVNGILQSFVVGRGVFRGAGVAVICTCVYGFAVTYRMMTAVMLGSFFAGWFLWNKYGPDAPKEEPEEEA